MKKRVREEKYLCAAALARLTRVYKEQQTKLWEQAANPSALKRLFIYIFLLALAN